MKHPAQKTRKFLLRKLNQFYLLIDGNLNQKIYSEEITEENKVEETPVISIKSSTPIAPTATPDVDEDGYSIQPKDPLWETVASKKGQ